MKKGSKKLLLFMLAIITILLLNSFVSSILSRYAMALFLFILLIIFKIFFGFEKDRHRYTRDIIYEIITFLLVFFIGYYILGLIIGFAKTDNYYSFNRFIEFVLPIILIIILKEYLRYMMLQKCSESKILILANYFMFLLIDISSLVYYSSFKTAYDVFIFIAINLMPAISENIFCTYVTRKVGYKPVILYSLIINLYTYLLPLVPNPNQYIYSIIMFLLPILLMYRVYLMFLKIKNRVIDRDYNKRRIAPLIIPAGIIVILVYLTSGYFHYYAVAIASGSMTPIIKKGDVVIIEKKEDNFEELEIGQVIAYKYNEVMIVHRLVHKTKIGDEYYFYTKGDANADWDNYPITESMIVGVVNIKIPYIGLPTVWLNDL